MGEDVVTSPGGTITGFRRLNGSIGARSICRSKDLDPSPGFAEDGRQLMV